MARLAQALSTGRRWRPVLAAALRDVLPEKIVARERKAHFGILETGFARHKAALEAVINEAPIPDGILDRQVVLDVIEIAENVAAHVEFDLARDQQEAAVRHRL